MKKLYSITLLSMLAMGSTIYAGTPNDILSKYGYETVKIKADIDEQLNRVRNEYESESRDEESKGTYNAIREASILMQQEQKARINEELEKAYKVIASSRKTLENGLINSSTKDSIVNDLAYKIALENANRLLAKLDEFHITESLVMNSDDLEFKRELLAKLEEDALNSHNVNDIGNTGTISPPFEGTPRLTSSFGTRVNPITGVAGQHHNALDYGLTMDTPLYASFGGKVTEAGFHATLGNYIRIDHGLGLETLYAHCNRLVARDGDVVNQGDLIAMSGNTGNSTGPHLHWGVYINKRPVDPSILLE